MPLGNKPLLDPMLTQYYVVIWRHQATMSWLSGVPDYFDRNKISSGGDLSHYSSASLY